jgi:hypothetical protein
VESSRLARHYWWGGVVWICAVKVSPLEVDVAPVPACVNKGTNGRTILYPPIREIVGSWLLTIAN